MKLCALLVGVAVAAAAGQRPTKDLAREAMKHKYQIMEFAATAQEQHFAGRRAEDGSDTNMTPEQVMGMIGPCLRNWAGVGDYVDCMLANPLFLDETDGTVDSDASDAEMDEIDTKLEGGEWGSSCPQGDEPPTAASLAETPLTSECCQDIFEDPLIGDFMLCFEHFNAASFAQLMQDFEDNDAGAPLPGGCEIFDSMGGRRRLQDTGEYEYSGSDEASMTELEETMDLIMEDCKVAAAADPDFEIPAAKTAGFEGQYDPEDNSGSTISTSMLTASTLLAVLFITAN